MTDGWIWVITYAGDGWMRVKLHPPWTQSISTPRHMRYLLSYIKRELGFGCPGVGAPTSFSKKLPFMPLMEKKNWLRSPSTITSVLSPQPLNFSFISLTKTNFPTFSLFIIIVTSADHHSYHHRAQLIDASRTHIFEPSWLMPFSSPCRWFRCEWCSHFLRRCWFPLSCPSISPNTQGFPFPLSSILSFFFSWDCFLCQTMHIRI